MEFFTYQDAVEHGLDYISGASDQDQRDARRCVLQAYRALVNARPWSYLATHGRVNTSAPYETGTIAYDHAGGTYEREVLLSDGTWPAWAAPGTHLRVGEATYEVLERRSDESLTLAVDLNPGEDVDLGREAITGLTLAEPQVVTSVAHGLLTGDRVVVEGVESSVEGGTITVNGAWTITKLTADTFELDDSDGTADDAWDSAMGTWRDVPTTTYALYRDVYLLPEDFVAADTAFANANFGGLDYSDATSWLEQQRYVRSSGTPRWYAITGDVRSPLRLAIRFSPYPDLAASVDFIYTRRARALRTEKVDAGTATVEAGSTTVAGNGTAWTSALEGSVLRLGTTRAYPTSWIGGSPPLAEAVIREVVSVTELRLAESIPSAFAEVRYVISDPIDVEPGAMLNAFLRGVEMHLHIARFIKDKPDAYAGYDRALKEAQAADSRSFQGRAMGDVPSRRASRKDMPLDLS